MKKYVIINTSDLSNVDYTLVEQNSLETEKTAHEYSKVTIERENNLN